MGLYSIPCRACGQLFLWFSGNLDQRCQKCVIDWQLLTLAEPETPGVAYAYFHERTPDQP